MKSTSQKIIQLEGLVGTSDLNAWETQFVEDLLRRNSRAAILRVPLELSEKQLEVVERLWSKHFA